MQVSQESPRRPELAASRASVDADVLQPHSWLDLSVDWLAQAMPGLPQLGAAMLMLFAYLACAGSHFGNDPATRAAVQQAQETAAAEVPGYRAF